MLTPFRVFCSFNCCRAYAGQISARHGDMNSPSLQYFFYQQCRKVFGLDYKDMQTVKPAPPRDSLAIYGGPLTIEGPWI